MKQNQSEYSDKSDMFQNLTKNEKNESNSVKVETETD